ncbi:MAG: hypothetical protein ISR25_03695 [Candidatus Poseidoniaceae archaeon]|nr:hypothetical protein [Candidatus Poseidoniaceae archaeon]MBL6889575.1 hypothetical protein [Candidatus Poseidoniaceae archaeon]
MVNNERNERNAMANHFFADDMANASRMLLMVSAVGLLITAVVLLFKNSDSTLMIIPIIGGAILMGFGYFLFDAKDEENQGSTAGVIMQKGGNSSGIEPAGDELPDLISSDYEIPIL